MEIQLSYLWMDWVLVVTDYDYESTIVQTRHEQGCPESASITDGYVQLEGSGPLVSKINKQLQERGDGQLFNFLLDRDQDSVTEQLLERIHDQQETQERDWQTEAEQAEWEKAEEFNNREVDW